MDKFEQFIKQFWEDLKRELAEVFRPLFSSSPAPSQDEEPRFTPPTYIPSPDVPQKKTENHRIAGTSFRPENLRALMGENSTYSYSKKELIEHDYVDERIYKLDVYYGLAVLEPEPDNPHDPRAIKVLTAGEHIGYIKAGSCAHIHKLIREGLIEKAEVEIKGGDYKIVLEDYDDYTDKSTYTLEKDSVPFSAILILTIKQ